MWIALRLVVTLVAFCARMVFSATRPAASGRLDGKPLYERIRRKKKKVTGFALGVELKTPALMGLHYETPWDHWFKALGLATELQTGDREFDRSVYVACDHAAVAAVLKGNEKARAAVADALRDGVTRVYTSAEVLWIERRGEELPAERDRQLLSELRRAFAVLESMRMSAFADPFFRRALLVEGLIWAAFGYAAAGFVEQVAVKPHYHVDVFGLAVPGLVVAALLFGALFGAVVALMSGSSRGHRILVESGVALLIALPVAGIQIVSDLNRSLDRDPGVTVTCEILRTEVVRGRRNSRYFIVLAPQDGPPHVPPRIRVDRARYRAAAPGRSLRMRIAPGALGLQWYREMVVVP